MDVIRAIESYAYYHNVTGQNRDAWEKWRIEAVEEWQLDRSLIQKGVDMRLHVDNYRAILDKSSLNDAEVCKRTGLTEKTLLWILDNGFIECETLERVADAIGCSMQQIVLPDITGNVENGIEWVKDSEWATLSLSQRRMISRVKKLAEQHPEQCQILAENEDGSIYAHIPVSWIRINPGMELTEEQKEKKAKTMRENIAKHKL